MKIVQPTVEFIAKTPNLDEVIEYACRTCYKSHSLIKEGSAEKLFNNIVKQSHHDSVVEHASISVQITTDRAVLAQFTRHRIGFSYSVESQRYCNYSKGKFDNNVSFIKPHDIEEGTNAFDIWTKSMEFAEEFYFELLNSKEKPETARAVLPNSTKVEMSVTGNIRAWRSFFKLRASGHAQNDIKYLCRLLHDTFIENGVPAYMFDDIEFDF